MTREELEELAESLEDQARDKDLLSGGDPESIFASDAAALREAARLLRSTQFHTKLGRSLWEECADCWLWRQHSFCPNCGRPLTEEAWAELERRLGGR